MLYSCPLTRSQIWEMPCFWCCKMRETVIMMPPDGERRDFDDGGDRWASDTDSEEEMNGKEEPIIGEFDEDGDISTEECVLTGEVDEDSKIVVDENQASNKRKPEEHNSSDLLSKKKNKNKNKNENKKSVKTTSS